MKTLFAALTSLCVLGFIFMVYLSTCESLAVAIKCGAFVGTIASVFTFILIRYGDD